MKIDTPKSELFLIPVFVLLLLTLNGCSQKEAGAVQNSPPPPSVTVSTPLKKFVTRFADFTGTIEAVESVTIRARVEGELEKIHFTEGDIVNKGDLLYSIDDRPYQTRLAEAEAELAVRIAEWELAKATSLRRERALKDRAVSEVAVIEANANLATATADVAAARAAVERAKLDLSYTRIKAPISGRIARTLVDAGNLVGAEERTLLTIIVRDDSVYAYFNVNERDLFEYRQMHGSQPSPANEGTPVSLGLANQTGYPFEGRIDYIHNQVDTATGTIRMRAVFPNPDRQLLPGLFARIRIPVGEASEALLVPDTALGQDQQGSYVLLVDPENKVRHQPVKTGVNMNGFRVIAKGISVQDRIIVNGLQRAFPGAAVTPMEETATGS